MKKIIGDALDNIKQFQSRLEDVMETGITIIYYENNKEIQESVELSKLVEKFNQSDNTAIQVGMLVQYYKHIERVVKPSIRHNLELLFVQLTEVEKLMIKPTKVDKKPK